MQVEYGRPNRLVDGTGWVLGIPNKLALWDRRADNHEISPPTEIELTRYLEHNRLNTVLVRVNQYEPFGEWHRLIDNKQVSGGWRYTVGALNMLKYTLLPGRLRGGRLVQPLHRYHQPLLRHTSARPLTSRLCQRREAPLRQTSGRHWLSRGRSHRSPEHQPDD